MKKMNKVIVLGCILILLPACAAFKQKKVEKEMKQPINCATADGDIRMLKHEKAHVAQRIIEGATAITPAGIVIGNVSRTEVVKLKVAAVDYNKNYNKKIDKRIAEIKEQCGVE
jgi:hypothetical protein